VLAQFVGHVEETDGSIDVGYPAGVAAGDIIFLAIVNRQAGGTVGTIDTPPGGWTAISISAAFRNGGSTLTGTFALYYKVATGSESGTETITRTGDTGAGLGFAARMILFRGLILAIDGTSINQESANATIDINAVTVNGPERTLLAVIFQCGSDDAGTPAGYTNAGEGGTTIRLEFNYLEDVSVGTATTATGGSTDGWGTAHVSIFNVRGRSFIVN
jgi:hypothetical protein